MEHTMKQSSSVFQEQVSSTKSLPYFWNIRYDHKTHQLMRHSFMCTTQKPINSHVIISTPKQGKTRLLKCDKDAHCSAMYFVVFPCNFINLTLKKGIETFNPFSARGPIYRPPPCLRRMREADVSAHFFTSFTKFCI
jgi:hypothetical protein